MKAALLIIITIMLALPSQLAAATPATPTTQKTPAPPATQKTWKNGPSTDTSYFPIGVWAQNPRDAAKYKALGVNFFLSIPGGLNADSIRQIKAQGMRVISHQNDYGLANLDEPTIMGWMHGDEPDNFAKRNDKWVPKRSTADIIADYRKIVKKDPSRPVLLNLGQGVANDGWKGGWAKEPDYREFVKGCDIVSYDIYPGCSPRANILGKFELVPKGVDRLVEWTEGQKIVWFIVECTNIKNPTHRATPQQVRSEVWMAITHGARGIIYFCHQWEPTRDFRVPLNDPVMGPAIKKINARVHSLAEVINSPEVEGVAELSNPDPESPIGIMARRYKGDTYILTSLASPKAVKASFQVNGISATATAEVLDEDRTITVNNGVFEDDFAPYATHLYKISDK